MLDWIFWIGCIFSSWALNYLPIAYCRSPACLVLEKVLPYKTSNWSINIKRCSGLNLCVRVYLNCIRPNFISIFFASICISFSFPQCCLWLLLMTHPLANFNRAFQSIPGRRSLVMLRWLSMLCSCDHSVDLLELSPLWFKQPKLSSIKYLCMKLGNSFLSIDLCSLAGYFWRILITTISIW